MAHMFELGIGDQGINFPSLALFDGSSGLMVPDVHGDTGAGGFLMEDEGDVFQCGKCKEQFGSLGLFMIHKREGCALSSTSVRKEMSNMNKTDPYTCSSSEDHYITDTEDVGQLMGNSASTSGGGNNGRHYDSYRVQANIVQDNHSQNFLHERHSAEAMMRSIGGELSNFLSPASGSGSLVQVTPSVAVADETISLTIPVDHNSQLGQLIAGAGPNSHAVLQIQESELAALLAAIDQAQGHSAHPGGFVLTASVLPSNSNSKEPLSERNLPANSGFIGIINGQTEQQTLLSIKRDNMISNGSRIEVEGRLTTKPTPSSRIARPAVKVKKEAKPKPKPKAKPTPKPKVPAKENNQCRQRINKVKAPATTPTPPQRPTVIAVKRQRPTHSMISTTHTHSHCNGNTTGTTEAAEPKRKCEYCGKPFKKLFNLHQHIRSHTGEKPFHCLVCGRGFTQKSNVKKHMQTHKVWPKIKYTLPKEQISVKRKDGEEATIGVVKDGAESKDPENFDYVVNNVYVCQYCDQHFENYHKLKTHLSSTHKNEKLFKCIHKDCVATFIEVEGLIDHMKTHEDQIEYQCQNCAKKFKNLFDLDAHQYTHLAINSSHKVTTTIFPKFFRCTKCNSKYASAEALNHHLLTSSHNYPCSQCQLTFVCERYLRRHLRIHGTVEPYKCQLCGKMFKTENYLKSHLVIHSDSKPFHCDICKQSFNRRDKLTRHKLMHDQRKKYKCPYKQAGCEREFYRKDKLKDHMTSHCRKMYPCSKCDKNFSWPVRLRKHQISQHPEMMSSSTCQTCHKIFKTKHHLKAHICRQSVIEIEGLEISRVSNEQLNTNDSLLATDQKVGMLYSDFAMPKIEDSVGAGDTSGSVKSETCIMLGSFNQSDDSESAVLSGLTSSMAYGGMVDLPTNEDAVMDSSFVVTGVDGQMDHLIAAD